MCKSVSLFSHVTLFLFAALVMLLFKVLLCVLKVKTLPQGFFVHRRDWEQWWHLHCDLFGVFWSWWSKDGLDPADLYLHFHSAICQHQRPLTNTPFHPPCAPSHHHLPTLHPPASSTLPAFRSAQVCKMWWGRQAGGNMGPECWGELLLSGKYVLIKKKKKPP